MGANPVSHTMRIRSMGKSIFEQLNEIQDEEQLQIASSKLPVYGKWDSKKRCVVVDGNPPHDADDWDKIYEETHPQK